MSLHWPSEVLMAEASIEPWQQPPSNCVLDFHGDPVKAQLVVFSDGNHHMALLDALNAFHGRYPEIEDIFYATTPPHPILNILRKGAIRMGNWSISIQPHVFLSPSAVMDQLASEGRINSHQLLANNQGSVLLVPKGNQKRITSIADLMRPDVRLFISNPDTETVSYTGYRQTLEGAARRQGIDVREFCDAVFGDTIVQGQCIHHREAPEALAAGHVDAAMVYYHLALRYTRIFPDRFDFIPLGGTREDPRPYPENCISDTHIGLVGDGGKWGQRLVSFMLGSTTAAIYGAHGLKHING